MAHRNKLADSDSNPYSYTDDCANGNCDTCAYARRNACANRHAVTDSDRLAPIANGVADGNPLADSYAMANVDYNTTTNADRNGDRNCDRNGGSDCGANFTASTNERAARANYRPYKNVYAAANSYTDFVADRSGDRDCDQYTSTNSDRNFTCNCDGDQYASANGDRNFTCDCDRD